MKHILLVFSLLGVTAYAQNSFQNYYDRDLSSSSYFSDNGESIAETSDGGFIAVGSSNLSSGPDEVYAVRMNSTGDTLWTRIYGDATKKEFGRAVIQTQDGGFVIAGQSLTGSNTRDGFVMKADSLGALLWSKTIVGTGYDLANDVIEMADGSLIVAGRTATFGAGSDDMSLIKLDSGGNLVWAKTIGGSSSEYANAIDNTSDGGFVIAGTEGTYSWGGFGVVKFDVNGDTLWSRGYRVQVSSYDGLDIDQTADGGYIVSGTTYGGTIGGLDMVMLKISSTGAVEWSKEYGSGGTDQYGNAVQTADGGYLLGGSAPVNGGSIGEMVMVKTDATGVISWSKGYSAEYGSYSFSSNPRFQVMQSSDGSYVMVGGTGNNFSNTYPNSNSYDLIVTKADSDGNVPQGCFKDAGVTSATVTYTEFMAPLIVASSTPTLTSGTFVENKTAGNYGNTGLKMSFNTTGVSCGLCDGSAEADMCDSLIPSICSGALAQVYTYLWDSNTGSQTTATATGLCSGGYTITVTDMVGCTGVSSTVVNSAALPQDICLITVDTSSTKNEIVWEKPVTIAIDSFNIYREVAGTGYVKVGSVGYNDISQFVDNTGGINPNITSYKYKMSTIDTCGNESVLSDYHKTINMAQPTGGGGTTVSLIWDKYEGFGFSYYYISLYNPVSQNWDRIDSVGTSNFIYNHLAINQPAYDSLIYRIEVVHDPICVAAKAAINHNSSRSNRAGRLGPGVGIKEQHHVSALSVYPNPANSILNVEFKAWNNASVEIEIVDLVGKTMLKKRVFVNTGYSSIPVDLNGTSAGFYQVRVSTAKEQLTEKIIIQ